MTQLVVWGGRAGRGGVGGGRPAALSVGQLLSLCTALSFLLPWRLLLQMRTCLHSLNNADDYTFHSYRRTSATTAANGGMTSEQMQGFYGWKSASMCQEYISTSRPAIMRAAQTLGSFEFGEPEVEVEVEVAVAEDELDLSDFVMEEDAEMCAAAGIPVSAPSTLPNSVDIQQRIESALSSVPACKLPM